MTQKNTSYSFITIEKAIEMQNLYSNIRLQNEIGTLLEIIQNGFKDSFHHSRATTSILAYMVLSTAIALMLWSFKLQQSNLVFWIQLYQDIRTGEF